MKKKITLRECVAPDDTERFWRYLTAYFRRDIQPPEEEYFYGGAYRARIEALHERANNPVRYLLFQCGGSEIGLALTVIYKTEDGKQFIMEFCVFPEFRGDGTGRACAALLLDWGRENGAKYAELSAGTQQRQRFWGYSGFVPNGCLWSGSPLMLRKPEEDVPLTVGLVTEAEEIVNLVAGFRAEIGEAAMRGDELERLMAAVREEKIIFFAARRLTRPVGICSVTCAYSTFSFGEIALFDDFYVEPVFRGSGAAQLLAQAAQSWCAKHGIASLSVTCADCDTAMYRALGFTERLGQSFSCIM